LPGPAHRLRRDADLGQRAIYLLLRPSFKGQGRGAASGPSRFGHRSNGKRTFTIPWRACGSRPQNRRALAGRLRPLVPFRARRPGGGRSSRPDRSLTTPSIPRRAARCPLGENIRGGRNPREPHSIAPGQRNPLESGSGQAAQADCGPRGRGYGPRWRSRAGAQRGPGPDDERAAGLALSIACGGETSGTGSFEVSSRTRGQTNPKVQGAIYGEGHDRSSGTRQVWSGSHCSRGGRSTGASGRSRVVHRCSRRSLLLHFHGCGRRPLHGSLATACGPVAAVSSAASGSGLIVDHGWHNAL